jgi:hypothetical protein
VFGRGQGGSLLARQLHDHAPNPAHAT